MISVSILEWVITFGVLFNAGLQLHWYLWDRKLQKDTKHNIGNKITKNKAEFKL